MSADTAAQSTHEIEITPELIAEHGLTPDEYDRVVAALGRAPNITELGIYSVMWSEHCSYKSSRVHLKKLPTKAPWVIQGPGENAGVVGIGDGQAAIFKMESHNHPSYIEPYQGAATGVGGILRDVFTMGARPIANMNALRFGAPEHPKSRHLIAGVVAGIGGYGNCVGVPTVGGETNFDARYNGNILVNAMTVGLADTDKIFYSAAAGIGNPVVYVGSKTGRDGIHGATMASAEFSKDTEEKRPTVQVGDPFTEKLLIEACLELMASDAIVAIQDMGAAGLTSSSVEMASKGGVGIELDLDNVPARETAMTAYEMMLSESQERMLMVLKPGREGFAKAIFDKWELDFAVIGKITQTGNLTLTHQGAIVADIPLGSLTDDAPAYHRPYIIPKPSGNGPAADDLDPGKVSGGLKGALTALIGSPHLASRRWIWDQYDHTVMGDSIGRPGGDAAVVRVHGTKKAIAITTDVTPRYCEADPVEGGKQAVAEAYRNLCAVGAKPLAITDCLNFGNPERSDVMGQFVGCVEGMAEACSALMFPVVSGNVSLYNETNGVAILPTPAVGAIGLIAESAHRATIGFQAEDEVIILIGGFSAHLPQSLYARHLFENEDGPPPPVDLDAELRNGTFVREEIASGHLTNVHDISDGGLIVAIAEMAMAGGLGAVLTLPDDTPLHAILFGEGQARYLCAVPRAKADGLIEAAQAKGIEAMPIGHTAGSTISVNADTRWDLSELKRLHESWFPDYMAG
ncbi:MAG: phosphoribosylformylglycinamidine synthase subunit PurL [Pseudomonadota bacterium]